jgi:hypothetical protein
MRSVVEADAGEASREHPDVFKFDHTDALLRLVDDEMIFLDIGAAESKWLVEHIDGHPPR